MGCRRVKKTAALGGTLALVALAAACGSSGSSGSSSGGGGSSSKVLVGRRQHLVAPLVAVGAGLRRRRRPRHRHLRCRRLAAAASTPITAANGRLRRQRRAADAAIRRQPARAACRFRGRLAATCRLTYNVKGVPDNLKLTGPVLADIYLGNISSWNDSGDREAEPGREPAQHPHHPDLPQRRIRHSFVLTSYLSAVSPDWASKVGASTQPTFPTGTGAEQNSGVVAAMQATDGAIALQWRCRTSPPTAQRCADRRTRPATTESPTEKAISAAAARSARPGRTARSSW